MTISRYEPLGSGAEAPVGESGMHRAEAAIIRGAEPTDVAALTELARQVMAHPWSPAQIREALETSGARVRLLDAGAGKAAEPGLIGFVVARRVADLLEIDLVGIDPGARRQGRGRQLLEHLIEDEAQAGAVEVQLELAATNEPARALYEGLGFVVVGRRSRYYPDGADALLLSRSLVRG